MKRKILPIIIITALLITSFAYANTATKTMITMLMDGKNVNFNVVKLMLNNKLIDTDVPPVIHNNRTLVPLRAIMENLQADVTWNGEKKEVLVKTEDKSITLNIDKSFAIVNGVKKSLPDNVPAKLINNRTMVPIRFLAEEIGLEVLWDDKTRTVNLNNEPNNTDDNKVIATKPVTSKPVINPPKEEEKGGGVLQAVTVNENVLPEIRIKLTEEVNYQEIILINPTRLVLDLENTTLQLDDPTQLLDNSTMKLPINKAGIKEARVSQFSKEPLITRVVIEMENNLQHSITFDEETNEMVIGFTNYVHNVKAQMFNTKEIVIIEGNNVSNYNVIELDNPKRLVVDVLDAYLDSPDSKYTVNVDGKVVKKLRVSQFQPDHHYKAEDKIVRTVIDIQDNQSYDGYFIEVKGNQLWVHIEGKPYEAMAYIETGWTSSQLIFKGTTVTRYQVNRGVNSNILEVVVPKENLPLEFTSVEINDHMVDNISVEEADDENYNITIELKENVVFEVVEGMNAKDLILELKNTNKYRELLIVIDPGHGGKDGGATSPNLKIKEKDLVLDVSKRLNELLLEAGFRTYMTRTDDTFVELKDRPGVANQLGADLFVSVHANATGKSSINGIENYYYPSEKNPEDNRDNKTLATIFQNTMTTILGANSRRLEGVEAFVVTRETKMPAVLTEMGFLTNPEEEAKLATDAYRQKVAEALFTSIVKYYDEINK
ncbi:N-acetylmuramoyl-L-alanine amidase family protein [Alkaliphilus serpentinus]|uniref:AMIN domain-containing protein n=1 Tax=Alkaliphilus serpentinus TaxID=1482731 RepID=A0A833HNY0_9FIRM|nr:N-acetylmuramoyl-L-alanine amidase family protein [Alkaliphilus serpentinus]KAB3530025.1 AMIN domain-containing protein [Alkaliphilus serpentinus]